MVAGFLSFGAFVAYLKLHWKIFYMIQDNIPITYGFSILFFLSKPASVIFALLSVVFYLIALRQKEPIAARLFALACAMASCTTIPVFT